MKIETCFEKAAYTFCNLLRQKLAPKLSSISALDLSKGKAEPVIQQLAVLVSANKQSFKPFIPYTSLFVSFFS